MFVVFNGHWLINYTLAASSLNVLYLPVSTHCTRSSSVGRAMAGHAPKDTAGEEAVYDRKVDALWEEKRDLIGAIVGVIEGMGKLTEVHQGNM